jgi:hypothetical protein
MGASDSNNDGVVNYRDILFTSMKNVSDFSRVVPQSSGYVSSIHAGNPQAKAQSLINISLSENHLATSIVPDTKNTKSHNPALEIKSTANGWKILFTLDNSSPHPNNPNTQVATWSIVIPAQNAVLYYREMFQIDGQSVLGKVQRFDLKMDWIELSQEKQTYNSSGKSNIVANPYSYKDTTYTIIVESGVMNPGYTYPKHVWCFIGTNKADGCDLWPYLVYSPTHESRIVALIHEAAKSYIDTLAWWVNPIPPETPKEESHETLKNGVSYKASQYWIYNDWTIWSDGKRTYPVKISGEYTKKDGTKTSINWSTISSAAERDSMNTAFENNIKSLIDTDLNSGNSQYKQNEERIYQENPAYYGGWYKVYYYWNQNGNADYPMKIVGTYAVMNKWRQPNIEYIVYSESERSQVTNTLISDIQSKIQAWYNTTPPPTYPQWFVIDSGFIHYKNGYGYNIFTTMNVNGNADYPATVYALYTSPSGGWYTQTLTAHNPTELTQIQNERANDAKARIDLELQNDNFPPGATEQIIYRRWHGTGSYEVRFTYSLNNWQDYPGYLDAYYTRWDGYTGKITMEAANANQKISYAPLLEQEARTQIDNYPYYSPNTITSSWVISYGSRGSSYEIFAKYNRVWTGNNYPALVWIQYRSGTYGQLLDTRNTYGITEARDSEEKERIKSQLESWVKWQMLAANGEMNTQYAVETTREKILRFLPFGTAHAATDSTIMVRKWAEFFGKVSPYTDPNYSVVQNFLAWVGKQTYLHKKWGNKPGVSGKDIETIKSNSELNRLIKDYSELQYDLFARILSTKRILCSGVWTTVDSCISENTLSFPNPVNTWDDIRFKMADTLIWWYWSWQADKAYAEMYKYPENFIIMFALIYEEQSHLSPPFFEDIITKMTTLLKGGSQSLWLSQITTPASTNDQLHFGYKTYSVEEILDTASHIWIMNERIEIIKKKLREKWIAETPEMIWRVWNWGYNCIIWTCSNHAIEYWKRVQEYANALNLILKK